jgi:predicted cupin superfamily sugar epimerase
MNMKTASYWVDRYNLLPHPEGGYYAETYRSGENIGADALPTRFEAGGRSFSTGIYFLLEQGQFSAFHKIKSDEMWHFYSGDALDIFVINPHTGLLEVIRLGSEPENGESFQAVVPAGSWFASRPAKDSTYALVGCTVSPGFDFADFEMASRKNLLQDYPQHTDLILELT